MCLSEQVSAASEDSDDEDGDTDDTDDEIRGSIGERLRASRAAKRANISEGGPTDAVTQGGGKPKKKKRTAKKDTVVTHADFREMLQEGEDHDDPESESDDVRSHGHMSDLGNEGGLGGYQFIASFTGLTPESVLEDDSDWVGIDDPNNVRIMRDVSFDDSLLRERTEMENLTVISSVVVCTPQTGSGPQHWHWDAPPELIIQYKLKNAFENISTSASYEFDAGDKRIVLKPGEALFGSALTLHRGSSLKHFGRVAVLFSELELNRAELRVLRNKIKYLSKPKFTDLPDSWPSYSIFDPINLEPPEDENQ